MQQGARAQRGGNRIFDLFYCAADNDAASGVKAGVRLVAPDPGAN